MENYLNFLENKDYEKLKDVSNMIKVGKLVVFPTDTVYGIGTNGLNSEAVRKLYNVKKRPFNKPICLLVKDLDMINTITQNITDLEYELMKKFFPGPFTIILKKKNIVPDILTSNQDSVAVRIPNDEVALKLLEYANIPIATTSANISGFPSEKNCKNVLDNFCNNSNIDYFIDNGESKLGIASTIIKVENKIPYIIREGSITKEQIDFVCKEFLYNKA